MHKFAILTSYMKEYVKYDFYFPSEKLFRDIFVEHGIEVVYVSPYYYDAERQEFTEHVVIQGEKMKIIRKPYKPDLLRLKMSQTLFHLGEQFADAPFETMPSMRLKQIESDKYQVYKYLEKYQPMSALLTSFYFYPRLQKKFAKKVVVKPIMGSGGYGINFFERKDVSKPEVFMKYSGTEAFHLVQDYKNFSK